MRASLLLVALILAGCSESEIQRQARIQIEKSEAQSRAYWVKEFMAQGLTRQQAEAKYEIASDPQRSAADKKRTKARERQRQADLETLHRSACKADPGYSDYC
jgi:uncharacterized lipoprotein